jgi:chromosome segregation ATPase
MLTSRHIAAAVTLSSFVWLGGCATTSGGLSSSADRLERNAETLARNADDDYSRDARELADQAQDFRQAVQDRRADDRDIRGEFEELSRDYHALRDEIDRSDSREAQMDFRAVTEAYLDIEREMSEYDRDRYASDDDRRKRF